MPRMVLFAAWYTPIIAAIGLWYAVGPPAGMGREPVVAGEPNSENPTSSSPSDASDLATMPAEFTRAGVCARCHVFAVLEWGVSGHVDQDTDCQDCHGPSRGHVLDERNEVKPDRTFDTEAKRTDLCRSCHEEGCPTSNEPDSCQRCHHAHALINPTESLPEDPRLAAWRIRRTRFQKEMAAGDQHVHDAAWRAAQTAYQAALKLFPKDSRARARLAMCVRRLNPDLPGFNIVGDRFDVQTGLPQEVTVVGLEIPMLLVPAGEFDLGSDDLADSRPVHTVRVKPFYLGRHEITQMEWESVMNTNPSTHQGPDHADAKRMPVEHVSWDDCRVFIRQLNARVPGAGFRLPTEAEWEYACRAGSVAPFSREDLRGRAWFRVNSVRQPVPDAPFLPIDAYAPRPVSTRRPNAWGFYDMQGNVWEWCSSSWQPYPYRDPEGHAAPPRNALRLLRGGSFADGADLLDPALRHAERPHRRLRWNGLRLARDVPPGPG